MQIQVSKGGTVKLKFNVTEQRKIGEVRALVNLATRNGLEGGLDGLVNSMDSDGTVLIEDTPLLDKEK
jgi:hypothetical protein